MFTKKELSAFQEYGLNHVRKEREKIVTHPWIWPEKLLCFGLLATCAFIVAQSFPYLLGPSFLVPWWADHLMTGWMGLTAVYQVFVAFGCFILTRKVMLPAVILFQKHRLSRAVGESSEVTRIVFFCCVEMVTIALCMIAEHYFLGLTLFITFIFHIHTERIINHQVLRKLENRGYRELVLDGARQFMVSYHTSMTSVTPSDMDRMGLYMDDMVVITNPDNGRQIHRHLGVREGDNGYAFLNPLDFLELQLMPSEDACVVLVEPY